MTNNNKTRVIDPIDLKVQETDSGIQLWFQKQPILLPNGQPLTHARRELVEGIREEFSGFGTVTLDAEGRVLEPLILSSYVLLADQRCMEADPNNSFLTGFGKWLLLDPCLSKCAGPEYIDQMARWLPLSRYFKEKGINPPDFPQVPIDITDDADIDAVLRQRVAGMVELGTPEADEFIRYSKMFVEAVEAEFKSLGQEEWVVIYCLFQCHQVVLFPLLLATGRCTAQEYANGLMAAHCLLTTTFGDIDAGQHAEQARGFREDANVALQFLEHARCPSITNLKNEEGKGHAPESLDQWFETLPFPLASILRAWQATPSQDFKTKYEHLLHFFEGAAQFISVILLSAFNCNDKVYSLHRQKLRETMQKQNLSFNRATFGTWKLVVEYFGKQTRDLLNENGKQPEHAKNDRALCAEMFADPSLSLPTALSQKKLAAIFSATNKMRNDWGGHGGVVGQEDAQLRNKQLLEEVQKLREVIGDTWSETQMIRPLHCRFRRGVFETEVAILMGSNSEFLKETRSVGTGLDVEHLYLSKKDSGKALKLLPLIQIGSSPSSAKNACYFFSRLERDGARFISYHFIDKPELKSHLADAAEVISLL